MDFVGFGKVERDRVQHKQKCYTKSSLKKKAAISAPATALKTCARKRYNAAPEGAEGQPAEGAFKNGEEGREECASNGAEDLRPQAL